MKFICNSDFSRVVSMSTLIFAAFLSSAAPAVGDTWSRTVLGQGGGQVDENGFPVADIYGDPLPLLPMNYQPSAVVTSTGLNVLRFTTSRVSDPMEVDQAGFPLLGEYFRFENSFLNGNAWTVEEPFTEWLINVVTPAYASRMDHTLSAYFWKESYLYIDTLENPSPTRLTLPIPAEKGTVAIDGNGGVHILSINADYELWHRYYDEGSLVAVKLSDGPVCAVVAVAGEDDECHVAYTTFSEDLNLNEALDEGEDVNGNSLLDVVAHEVVYQLIDANSPDSAETVVADALIRVCYLDLLFSTTYSLKVAYADPVTNAIRLAERGISAWSEEQISSTVGSYGPLALAIKSDGDCVVSFATQDGLKLSLTEETSGTWSETLIKDTTIGAYFTGTDVVVRANGDIVVLAAEKSVGSYLAAYTSSALPSLWATQVQPVSIRSAFVVTWPTPGGDVTQQTLQSTGDLSDPGSWADVKQQNWYPWDDRVAIETTVEQTGQQFYRVLELSE